MTTPSVAPLPNPRASLDLAVNLGLLVLLASLWGASYSFIKVGIETIPPITLIAGRTAIAWAEQTVDASLATILNSTSPIFIFLLAMVLRLEGERTWRKFLGVAFGFAGIVLVIGGDALEGLTRELISQLVIVGATICYAGAAVFGRRFSGMHAIVPAAGSMIAGGAVLIPASLVFEQPWTLSVSTDSALALLGLSVLSTALAFVIYFRLLKSLGSVGTAAQAYLRVPIGVALGALVLGETLPLTAWAGMACVIAGVAAMTLPGRRGGQPPAP